MTHPFTTNFGTCDFNATAVTHNALITNFLVFSTGTFPVFCGAEAIRTLLRDVDLERECAELKEELKEATGQKRTRAVRRLDILEAFLNSGNHADWMVMDVFFTFFTIFTFC